jgi:diaminopimelate decarboxylase
MAKARKIPEVKQGDLLAIFSTGAYCFSMSSNYNSRLRPAEIMVSNKNFKTIRRRETYKDLTKNE